MIILCIIQEKKLEMWANAQRDMVALPNVGGALC